MGETSGRVARLGFRTIVIPDEAPDVQQLRQELTELGTAHFEVCQISELALALDRGQWGDDPAVALNTFIAALWGRDPTRALNACVAALGLGFSESPVGRWNLLARDQAHTLLESTLGWEQAYDCPRLELSVADRMATAFVELFGEQARFFTNAGLSQTPLGLRATSWHGLVTGGTFEAGVVAFDERRVGLLYVEDED